MSNSIPIGTFLSRVQYARSQGKLRKPFYENPSQPFHFAVLKYKIQNETDEFMIYHVSTYVNMKNVCGSFHAMFKEFEKLFGEQPDFLECKGMNAALKYHKNWDCLLVLMTAYRFPRSYLTAMLENIYISLDSFFEKPSLKSAQFVQKAMVIYSKTMNNIDGVQSVLAGYKSSTKNNNQTERFLDEVGPAKLVSSALEDEVIFQNCAVFVYGKCLFTTMSRENLAVSEILVGNQTKATEEYLTRDGRLFCLARHYHTVMVSIAIPGSGLERCCKMQAALMKLDANGIVTQMQMSFANDLLPKNALDVFVSCGPFKVSQPPFMAAPVFARPDQPNLIAIATGCLLYETMSNPGYNAVIDFKYTFKSAKDQQVFRVSYTKKGDAIAFWIAPVSAKIDDAETASLIHSTAAIQG